MLCSVLEKYHSFPGFTLLLGGIFQYMGAEQPHTHDAGIVASSYLIQWQQEDLAERILEDTGFFGVYKSMTNSRMNVLHLQPNTPGFFSYLTELLESSEQSGTHIFNQQQYATAAKQCLQLFLCNHHNFSKGATHFAHHDKVLCRSKPWEWVARLGVRSRIRKGRHHFKVLWCSSMDLFDIVHQGQSFPENSPEHQHYRFLSYQWALDLLPFLLEKSAISLELANILHRHTFAMMAQKFPRRTRLAKEAITRYFLQVESAVGKT